MELCPEPMWESLCREDSTCTFYQTPAWLNLTARHVQATVVPILFRFGRRKVCLPLLKQRRLGRDRYFSPFGTYSAPVTPQGLTAEELASIARALRSLNLHLISSPFTLNAVTLGKPLPAKIQLIDLKSLDAGNPMRDWEEGQRRRVRVAQKKGVLIREASRPGDWDRYFALYELSLQRWGERTTLRHSRALFADLEKKLSGKPTMKLWLAEHEGVIGAGNVTFYHNQHVVPWHGAADKNFFQLGATQSLFLTQINDAKQRGFSIFDLTGSGRLSGVESFKSRFGTRTVEFTSCLNRPGIWGLLAKARDLMR